ncbi:MAG: Uma2 family endonuclease [Sphingobium sp.]
MTAQNPPDTRIRHKLTVEEFLLLDREGAFGWRSTELIDGEIFYMSPKHRAHARMIGNLYFRIRKALEDSCSPYSALIDVSVRLSDHDVPEPDIVITAEPDGDGIVPLETVKLVIEVADSTLATDLKVKAPRYAQFGVPEYWVVDVTAKTVHQMSAPVGDSYTERRELQMDGPVASTTIPDLRIDLV